MILSVYSRMTYEDVLVVRGISQVFVHLRLEKTLLMPLGPDGCLWAQSIPHEELLVHLELSVDSILALKATVFHQI